MKLIYLGIVASALTARAGAQAPASHPDVTGVWVMDTTRFHNTDSTLAALKLTVTRTGDTLTVVTDGTDVRGGKATQFTTRAVYSLNGAATRNPMSGTSIVLASTLAWDGDVLVLTSVADANGRSYKTIERWTVDAAGRTMSRTASFQMGGRDRNQTLVFSRLAG